MNTTFRTTFSIIIATCIMAIVVTTASAAPAPIFDQYGDPVAGVGDSPEVTGGGSGSAVAGDSVLPFTGGEFAYLMIGIALLGASGYALRRASRPAAAQKAA